MNNEKELNNLTESIKGLTGAVERLNKIIDKVDKNNNSVQPLKVRTKVSYPTRVIRRYGHWIL